MTLRQLRRQIDRIDRQILRLLNRRAVLALQVGRVKKSQGHPVFDGRREAEILQSLTKKNSGPFSSVAVREIFRAILHYSRRLVAVAKK